jgi:L-ribulokinase
MINKYVIGLDYGTKSARALLVNAKDGTVISRASMDYPHGVMDSYLPDGATKLEPDWVLQYPLDYLEVLTKTISDAVSMSDVSVENIIGLSLDFTACTMLPVDNTLKPLCIQERFQHRPHAFVKLWKHHAAQEQADKINKILEKMGIIDQYRYGGRVSSELLIPKILQIIEEDPEVYAAADQILEAADWLGQLLTGEKRRSASTAAYKTWWQELEGYPADVFAAIDPRLENLAMGKLSGDICPVGGRFGFLTAEWAEKLNLMPGIAVGCSVIDAHAGLPGCGITQPGRMMLIIGTSSVQAVLSEHPYSGNGIMGSVKNGIIPGYYALESGLAAFGDVFEWFIKNAIPAAYQADADAAGVSIFQYLSSLAEKYHPGESGLLGLDWWSGNKTPFVNSCLSGLIIGLTVYSKPEEIYRALVEAVGFGTRLIMEHFEYAGIKIHEIVACGGIAGKDPFLLNIFANITNREIKVSATGDTSALGAAMYASAAAGTDRGGYSDISAAAAAMSQLKTITYKPDPDYSAPYSILYSKYKELSDYFGKASDIMKILQELRSQILPYPRSVELSLDRPAH